MGVEEACSGGPERVGKEPERLREEVEGRWGSEAWEECHHQSG